MIVYIFLALFLFLEVAEQKFKYKIDTRKQYSPGYVCNYEVHHVPRQKFLLYTCVPNSQCRQGLPVDRTPRRPELWWLHDNCNTHFHPRTDGQFYVCCHPADNAETPQSPANGNATRPPYQLKWMPGLRSGFKCLDYSVLVCLDRQYCPSDARREFTKNGREISIGKYPHLTVVGYYNAKTKKQHWFCLGSIVSERFILSAAGCYEDEFKNKPNYVRVGEPNLCEVGVNCPPSKTAQRFEILKSHRHPNNRLAYYYHGLMLFELKQNITFNARVRPACLMSELYTFQEQGMFAVYEERIKDGKKQNITTEFEVQIFSTTACAKWFQNDIRLYKGQYDNETMFCAGLPQREKTPCLYDYGGPLQIQREAPFCAWWIYGVMSYSRNFWCKKSSPPMFTRVPFYIDWIESTVWSTFDMFAEHGSCKYHCKDALSAPTGPDGACPR